MRFSVHTKPLPWRVRLAILLGARVFAGAFEHEGQLNVTVGVSENLYVAERRTHVPIWWREWTASARTFLHDRGE